MQYISLNEEMVGDFSYQYLWFQDGDFESSTLPEDNQVFGAKGLMIFSNVPFSIRVTTAVYTKY